jgi:antitoxin HicB
MKYHFKIHKAKKGYWAECLELPGCHTQADNKPALLHNMQEALNLYLDEPEDSLVDIPLPLANQKVATSIVAVAVDTKIAFAVLLRKARLFHPVAQAARQM